MCDQLIALGYHTAVLCDNDAPNQFTAADIQGLRDAGAHICQWDNGNSTESQIFVDLPWQNIPALLDTICGSHDTIEHATVIDSIAKEPRVQALNLDNDPALWPESPVLRQVMGDLANKGKWIKRIDYAEKVCAFALPLFPEASILKSRLAALWSWIQRNE